MSSSDGVNSNDETTNNHNSIDDDSSLFDYIFPSNGENVTDSDSLALQSLFLMESLSSEVVAEKALLDDFDYLSKEAATATQPLDATSAHDGGVKSSATIAATPVFSGNGISRSSSEGTGVQGTLSDRNSASRLATSASNTSALTNVSSAKAAVSSNPTNAALDDIHGTTADEAIATASTAKRKQTTLAHSKRRKKPRLADCESKLVELQSENEVLKRHLANVSRETQAHEHERIESERKMEAMLQNGATDTDLDAIVEFYKEMYSDYGRRRQQELVFHLDQLSRLASPTNYTKMGLWTMGQQSKGHNPITGILTKELEIQPQQLKRILDQREKIREVCSNLKETLALIGKLKTLCEQKTTIFSDRMKKCREILTPAQVVKLLVWINNHSGVLHSVFPGWGSQIQMLQSLPKSQE